MLLQITCSPGPEDQDPLRTIQPSELFSYHLQRPPGEEQKLGQRLDKAITRIRPDQSRSPDIAPTQETRISQALHLTMHSAERRTQPPGQVCEAVLPFRVEQQRGKDVSLQRRPEHRKKCRSFTSHNSKISTI